MFVIFGGIQYAIVLGSYSSLLPDGYYVCFPILWAVELMEVIGACRFVCRDSAAARKCYAWTTYLSALGGIYYCAFTPFVEWFIVPQMILTGYYAWVLNRLAEAEKDKTMLQVAQFM